MRETHLTKKDKDFMNLRNKVFKIIPHPTIDPKDKKKRRKEWLEFVNYMAGYYFEGL